MSIFKNLPIFLFFLAIAFVLVLYGVGITVLQVAPYPQLRDAFKTGQSLWAVATASDYFGEVIERTDVPRDRINRWSAVSERATGEYWVLGGLYQFMQECPEFGCLAVRQNIQGEIITAIPFHPDQIAAASLPDAERPYENFGFAPVRDLMPIGFGFYDDGDVLVTFHSHGPTFPFGAGAARIGPDGTPRWFRHDYSHHWPTMLGDGTALLTTLTIGDVNDQVRGVTGIGTLNCDAQAQVLSMLRKIGPDGAMIWEVDLMQALLRSPFAQFLMLTSDPCDWIHLNYVNVLETAVGPDINAGDLLISMRNINALVIMDGESHELKKLIRGNFLQQHSAQMRDEKHLVLFDNWGGADSNAPEILEIDLETGQERVIFPNAGTPAEFRNTPSLRAGHIELSPDKTRLLIAYSEGGRGFEIDAETGELLAAYDHLHDVSSAPGVPDPAKQFAIRYDLFSMLY